MACKKELKRVSLATLLTMIFTVGSVYGGLFVMLGYVFFFQRKEEAIPEEESAHPLNTSA